MQLFLVFMHQKFITPQKVVLFVMAILNLVNASNAFETLVLIMMMICFLLGNLIDRLIIFRLCGAKNYCFVNGNHYNDLKNGGTLQ